MNLLKGISLVVLVSCGSAMAAEAPAKPATDGPKMVCFEAPRTGSNIKRKTCMTEAQAEQRRREDQAATENLKRGSAGRSSHDKNSGAGLMGR